MGIEGKALDEEIPGLQKRNTEFFTRFKHNHPEQMVLLHYNGNSRLPDHETGEFFAGHWLYFNGSKVLSGIPAGESETDIRVQDPSLFKTSRNANDDIGICELDASGKPNWLAAEQVQLISVNAANLTIRVKRGLHGTKARAFAAAQAYAAAHISEGPRSAGLEWFYNYATTCPRDAKGCTAADVLVEEFVRRFGPGGQFANFDGLQFDVLFFNNHYHPELRRNGPRGIDADADGQPDRGVIGGVNVYGIGVTEFCRKLRERFPADKILNADGMMADNQRSFGVLNGMESEGFPHLRDHNAQDWSGGLNRLSFWAANARRPVFNYINHKYIQPGREDASKFRPEVPFGIHRLSFAAGVLTDSAICYSYEPPAGPGEVVGIWDELWKGTEHEVGWLGMPAGPTIHLAERQPDLLDGKSSSLIASLKGSDVRFTIEGAAVQVRNTNAKASETRFALKGLKVSGPDLVVTIAMHGTPLARYPREIGRLVRAGIAGAKSEPLMSWMNEKDFTSTFYFADLPSSPLDLELTVEGPEPFWISSLSARAYPDAMCRTFERGLVLANPSPRPYTFRIADLSPGKSYRRLRGSSTQDPEANNGAAVGPVLEMRAKDAIFLVKQ